MWLRPRSRRSKVGPRTFAVVPIVARAGALGVLIFEKPDDTGFTPEDRDLLVAYADRVGADLESQVLCACAGSNRSKEVKFTETDAASTRDWVRASCSNALHVPTKDT
jgi:hypothetical protein